MLHVVHDWSRVLVDQQCRCPYHDVICEHVDVDISRSDSSDEIVYVDGEEMRSRHRALRDTIWSGEPM
jgi:hypothetical protein